MKLLFRHIYDIYMIYICIYIYDSNAVIVTALIKQTSICYLTIVSVVAVIENVFNDTVNDDEVDHANADDDMMITTTTRCLQK